jgi:hypothetical protein
MAVFLECLRKFNALRTKMSCLIYMYNCSYWGHFLPFLFKPEGKFFIIFRECFHEFFVIFIML